MKFNEEWFEQNKNGARKVFNTLVIAGAVIYFANKLGNSVEVHANSIDSATTELKNTNELIEKVDNGVAGIKEGVILGGEAIARSLPYAGESFGQAFGEAIDPEAIKELNKLVDKLDSLSGGFYGINPYGEIITPEDMEPLNPDELDELLKHHNHNKHDQDPSVKIVPKLKQESEGAAFDFEGT